MTSTEVQNLKALRATACACAVAFTEQLLRVAPILRADRRAVAFETLEKLENAAALLLAFVDDLDEVERREKSC